MELKVENMTCGGCVSSVHRILVKQLGVDESAVSVDLKAANAIIPAVPDAVLQEAIAKLKKAGFEAKPV